MQRQDKTTILFLQCTTVTLVTAGFHTEGCTEIPPSSLLHGEYCQGCPRHGRNLLCQVLTYYCYRVLGVACIKYRITVASQYLTKQVSPMSWQHSCALWHLTALQQTTIYTTNIVKRKGYLNQAAVASVVSQCLPCSNQRMCIATSTTYILMMLVSKAQL